MSLVLTKSYTHKVLADTIESTMDELAQRVIRTRNRRGQSLRAAGRAAGLAHVTIRNIELGERDVDVNTLCLILRWLDGEA